MKPFENTEAKKCYNVGMKIVQLFLTTLFPVSMFSRLSRKRVYFRESNSNIGENLPGCIAE